MEKLKEMIQKIKREKLIKNILSQLEKKFKTEEDFLVIERGPRKAFHLKKNGANYYFTVVVDVFQKVGILITQKEFVIESLLGQREIRGEYHAFLVSSKDEIQETMDKMENWITEKTLKSLFKV